MIGKWMETLDDAVLQRIADARCETWVSGFFSVNDECGCLAFHSGFMDEVGRLGLDTHPIFGAAESGGRYERLAARYLVESPGEVVNQIRYYRNAPKTSPRVVRMIQNRARKILATREIARMEMPEDSCCASMTSA